MSGPARVVSLWRHPVKSMRGERCGALSVERRGVSGDRVFAVRTPEGKLGSGKSTRRFGRVDGLLELESRLVDGAPEIRFPDGRCLLARDGAMDGALSAAFGQTVELVRETSVSHLDAAPVHIVTTASLAWLSAALPEAVIAAERFRPNLVIDAPGETPVELDWVGSTLQIGADVVLRVVAGAERCRMVGLGQGALPHDRSILDHVARHSRAIFGVYAEVVRAGTVAEGDAVEISPH